MGGEASKWKRRGRDGGGELCFASQCCFTCSSGEPMALAAISCQRIHNQWRLSLPHIFLRVC
ncbi:hypothetical protein MtrunA17_Chr3g0130081 [Medicago truncatula]|uniref:Uncharacterized protein n=1 Tax=Medicago truncatula TaxID=3880 RepID=A0A396J3Y2_MEDTR|nr:hypothetical protein MtrunA17_Chr3g0130081 [Medicago truncatula]